MKRGAALLVCLLLIAALALPARAEGQKLLYPGVTVTEDAVSFVSIPAEGGSIAVSAGGQTIPSTQQTVQDAGLGITYYCVVSTTSTLSNSQRQQQKEGLLALNQRLRPQDAMVLVTLGKEVSFVEKLTDAEARTAAIEAVSKPGVYGTNLFDGIDEILTTVQEQEQGLSCLVIFTDGKDNASTVKITEDQMARIIQSSGLNVNFIGLITPPGTNFDRNKLQPMERFAAMSLGGVYRCPLAEEAGNPVNAVSNDMREIVASAEALTVISVNTADIPRDGKTVTLEVTWTGEGRTVTDAAEVNTADLPALPEPTQPETEPPTQPPETQAPTRRPTEPTEPIPEYQGSKSEQMLFYVLIAAGVVVVLLVLVMIIVAARKTVPQPPEEREFLRVPKETAPAPAVLEMPKEETVEVPEEPEPQPPVVPEEETNLPDFRQAFSKRAAKRNIQVPDFNPNDGLVLPVKPAEEELPAVPTCTVSLIPVDNPEGAVNVEIPVGGSRTLGRNQKADVVLNEVDSALSGCHFELQWDGRTLYLTDRNSTNGTALSGIPQRPGHWARVENGATIQAGAFRYKVKIMK